ncbi:hypothetical protein [Merismopedia glauca]|uniref:Uncharacterized protein n=1 Tax=Merismopedia glauca CCAP 1448/3 TaxID=1296344 RepID=A0A2T1C374_9CYAN|nr:hypothetical protein [Merismopedia glauca]PSB02712.1 hypothetical protein C7B64_11820 [Merismopedia glauca CCAP 1448/3]
MNPAIALNLSEKNLDFSVDFHRKVLEKYQDISSFVSELNLLIEDLGKHRDIYNINRYPNPIDKGIHILSHDNLKFSLLPEERLVFKCSEGRLYGDNLRQQFARSLNLSAQFQTNLSLKEQSLLQICPTHFYLRDRHSSASFKEVLVMKRLTHYIDFSEAELGFDAEFCQVFQIPSLAEISQKPQFQIHLQIDRDRQRQLLKIQTAYLFKRLKQRRLTIWSLNQKNILVNQDPRSDLSKYVPIDPTADWILPITPIYNAANYWLCR